MSAVLQFAAFLSICWLIRGVITHPNQDDNRRLTDKPPNQNNPDGRDFYFEEQRTKDSITKTGRAIPQSAWSKEEKEQTQTIDNKTDTQSNDEFSFKSVLSYMLNMIKELKKDIFGIKEMASFKNKEESVNSQVNFEDKNKQNKMEEENGAAKSDNSPEYNQFERENQQLRSNYLTDYYQRNGYKFVDYEEEDDYLENFSDQSDDSSHQPNKEVNIQEINIKNKNSNQNDDSSPKSKEEVKTQGISKGNKNRDQNGESSPKPEKGVKTQGISKGNNNRDQNNESSPKPEKGVKTQGINKNNKNTYNAKCVRITRKPDKYSSGTEEITPISNSQEKIPEENVKRFDDNKENRKDDNFKGSTTKPAATEQNDFKSSREETENMKSAASASKIGKCVKKNNKNSINHLNEKNGPTEKPLKSVEYVTTKSPQKGNSGEANSKRSNQNKTPDNLSKETSISSKNPGKNLKNKDVSDFDNKSGVHVQSTLPSQNSNDFINHENKGNTNEPYTSGTFSEKLAYRKQQEQNTSPKPASEKEIRNNTKYLKNADRRNEHVTVSTTNHRMSTEAYSVGIEINDKELKDKRSTVISFRTTITYNENESDSKSDGQQNNFDADNAIQSTTSENIMNVNSLNTNLPNNFTDKKETNKNDESEKFNANNKDESDSESQGDSETEQPKEQQTNNDSESETLSKNNKINYSKPENDIKETDDNLSSTTPSGLHSTQDSKIEFQNHNVEEFGKPQEPQENNEELSEKDEMREILPDHEYEYEDDTEDFDISDELNMQDDQKQESEVNTNNGKFESNDEMYSTTVLIDEFQISEPTGDAMEEESEEHYDTLLEYIYKHSNNPIFQSLKNQSNDSVHG